LHKTQTGPQNQGCKLIKCLKELPCNIIKLFKPKQHTEENKTYASFLAHDRIHWSLSMERSSGWSFVV